MKESYELTSDYGAALFETRLDAVTALWMLGQYHDKRIDNVKVISALEKHGYYEDFPLSLSVCFG